MILRVMLELKDNPIHTYINTVSIDIRIFTTIRIHDIIYIYIYTAIRSYTCDISHTYHKITSEILLAVHILFPFNEITPVIDPAGTAPGIFFGLSSILWTVAIADSIRRHLDGYGPARRWEEPPCGDV